jgi:toxin secretion/phage lysis holin
MMSYLTGVIKLDSLQIMAGITLAALGTAASALLGGWDMWLQVLVYFVIADYLTGVLAAFCLKKLSSEVGARGIAKKVFIFLLVGIAYQIDMLAGTELVRAAVCAFYIGIEGLSVLENAGKLGIPLPEVLTSALEQMQNRGTEIKTTE